jgi:hypothetical protein
LNGFLENIGAFINRKRGNMRFVSTLNIFRIVLFCLIGFSATSCISYYSALTIEIPGPPAKEELPQDIQSITLMNRSMNNQFRNHNEDTLQLYFYDKGYQLSVIVLDSLAADTTIRALGELLFESDRYDVVIPIERNIERNISYNLVPDTLNPAFVSEQCQKYNTDALMVLEKFSTKVMTDNIAEKYSDKYSTSYSFYASLDLKYDAFFRIYKPGRKALEFQFSDTIYWESMDDVQVRMFSKIPSIKQALINAGIKVALDFDNKISPSWISEKRGYFLFDRKNDLGQQLLNENSIEEAKAFWMEKTQSTNKKTKSRAEHNLALASELEGNIDQAIEWGLKSFNTYYHYQTEVYLKKLNALQESKLTK